MKKRLESIVDKINDIEFFISQKNGKIMSALEDRILKPAITLISAWHLVFLFSLFLTPFFSFFREFTWYINKFIYFQLILSKIDR